MRVVFTPLAERQIKKLRDHIAAQASERREDKYVRRLLWYCKGLAIFPQRGRRRDDLLPGLRIVGFERRVTIAFVIAADVVLIEGVFHGGQDFEASFRDVE